MWTEQKVTFLGEYYRVNEADCEPKPDPLPPFIDLGVTSFIVDCGGFPDLTTLEMLINEVLPALNNCYEPKRNK